MGTKKKSLLKSALDSIIRPAEAPTINPRLKKLKQRQRRSLLGGAKAAKKRKQGKANPNNNIKDITKALAEAKGTAISNTLGERNIVRKAVFRDKNGNTRKGFTKSLLTPKKAINQSKRKKGK